MDGFDTLLSSVFPSRVWKVWCIVCLSVTSDGAWCRKKRQGGKEREREREREYVGVFQLENLTHYNWDKIMVMADWKTNILFPEILGVWSLLRSLLDGKEKWTPHQSKAVVWGTHWLLRDFDMVFHLPWEHPNLQLLAVLVANLFCGRDTGESRN